MMRVHLLVEGQTEEAFVNRLLRPYYERMGLWFTPIIVCTSIGHRGGVCSYDQIRPQIECLCRDTSAFVSTMFDLYGLPKKFPGQDDPAWAKLRTGQEKAEFIELRMMNSIRLKNFIPNIVVHEYEALLFVQSERFSDWGASKAAVKKLKDARKKAAPENINDNKKTAPSQRILTAMPDYEKVTHGVEIACAIGLSALRKECPHFNAWLQKLENIHTQGTSCTK